MERGMQVHVGITLTAAPTVVINADLARTYRDEYQGGEETHENR